MTSFYPPSDAFALFAQQRSTVLGQTLATPWLPLGLMPYQSVRDFHFKKDIQRYLTEAPAFGHSAPIISTQTTRPRVDILLMKLSDLRSSTSQKTLAFLLDHIMRAELEELPWQEEAGISYKGATVHTVDYKPPQSSLEFMLCCDDFVHVIDVIEQASIDLEQDPSNLKTLYNNLVHAKHTALDYYGQIRTTDSATPQTTWHLLYEIENVKRIDKIIALPAAELHHLTSADINDRLNATPAETFAALAMSPGAQFLSPYALQTPCWFMHTLPTQPPAPTLVAQPLSAATPKDPAPTQISTPQVQAPHSAVAGPHRGPRPRSLAKRLLSTRVPSGVNPYKLKRFIDHLHTEDSAGHFPEPTTTDATSADEAAAMPTPRAKGNGPKL